MDTWRGRIWARLIRKAGFSLVTVHRDHDGAYTGVEGRCYLHCNWPLDLADAPFDLLDDFTTTVDAHGNRRSRPEQHHAAPGDDEWREEEESETDTPESTGSKVGTGRDDR